MRQALTNMILTGRPEEIGFIWEKRENLEFCENAQRQARTSTDPHTKTH